jgi:hypothetical protein
MPYKCLNIYLRGEHAFHREFFPYRPRIFYICVNHMLPFLQNKKSRMRVFTLLKCSVKGQIYITITLEYD